MARDAKPRRGSRVAVFGLALLLIVAAALALRLPYLGSRPMHADEAVHAAKFRTLWETGAYRYDANEFHGPTLYYAALPVIGLSGARDFAQTRAAHYRLAIVLFGAGMVLLLALLADGLGWPAALWAAALLAVSPAMVFYSRYYIQETLLAFFTLAALAAGWRYARGGRMGWLALAGVSAGLMAATKETAALSFGACAVALAPAALHARRIKGESVGVRPGHLAGAAVLGAVVACLFLTGFFTNPTAPLDYARSYLPWLERAGGTDLHRHPWYYYLELLLWSQRGRGPVWSEGLVLALAAVGLGAAFLAPRRLQGVHAGLARFLGIYTLVLIAAYSLIPYKTPWCVLSFLQGLILLAGIGAVALVGAVPGRMRSAVALLLVAGTVHLGMQAYRAACVYESDGRNPYVYSPTAPDMEDLQARVEGLARVSPQGSAMAVQVLAEDAYYWPLPWYLRGLSRVGYWTEVPEVVSAPVVIAASRWEGELGARLAETHVMTGYYGLRAEALLQVWVRRGLWQEYLSGRGA